MFRVEVCIQEREENALTAKMAVMREWLDHRRFEPSTFRYTFTSSDIAFRVEFSVEAEAAMFAKEFGGRVVGVSADAPPQVAEPYAVAE
jgi:hypothetical protein